MRNLTRNLIFNAYQLLLHTYDDKNIYEREEIINKDEYLQISWRGD